MKNIIEYTALKNSIKNLDCWFDSFLKGKGKKMDHDNIDKPLWKEYHSKYGEYSKLSQKIRLIEKSSITIV